MILIRPQQSPRQSSRHPPTDSTVEVPREDRAAKVARKKTVGTVSIAPEKVANQKLL